MKHPFKDKQWLEEQLNKYGSGKAIARNTGCSETSIHRYLKKFSLNQAPTQKRDFTKDWLINEYKQGKTIRDIAKEQKCSTRTILEYNEKHSISPKEYNPAYEYQYQDKEWLEKQVELYGNGLVIAQATGLPVTSINRYITKFGLVERKYTTKQKTNQNDSYFELIDTEEKAYWLGFIMADGNMYERQNSIGNRYTLSIKLKSTDKEHLEKFANAIEFDGKINIREQMRNNTKTIGVEIRVNSPKMCEDLMRHGIVPRKSGKEQIPNSVPEHLIRHFIRGFFDGDGSINGDISKGKTARISFCSMSEKIINQIINYTRNDISINKYNYNLLTCNISKKESVYKFLRWLYKDATVYLDRKYLKSMDVILTFENEYIKSANQVNCRELP